MLSYLFFFTMCLVTSKQRTKLRNKCNSDKARLTKLVTKLHEVELIRNSQAVKCVDKDILMGQFPWQHKGMILLYSLFQINKHHYVLVMAIKYWNAYYTIKTDLVHTCMYCLHVSPHHYVREHKLLKTSLECFVSWLLSENMLHSVNQKLYY